MRADSRRSRDRRKRLLDGCSHLDELGRFATPRLYRRRALVLIKWGNLVGQVPVDRPVPMASRRSWAARYLYVRSGSIVRPVPAGRWSSGTRSHLSRAMPVNLLLSAPRHRYPMINQLCR